MDNGGRMMVEGGRRNDKGERKEKGEGRGGKW